MASWVKVGAKCVMVDHYFSPQFTLFSRPPPLKVELIVTGVIEDVFGRGQHIRIHGYPNYADPNDRSFDCGWRARRFRPLITKTQEQDIEMFLRIANDTPFHVMIDEELYPIG